MPNMNVSLPDELKGYVEQKVKAGLYGNASEVVREGLRLLRQRDRQEEIDLLRKRIDLGFEQSEHGQVVSGEEAFQRLRDRSARRRTDQR